MQPSKQDYVNSARNWLGVRWVHQGRSRNGLDCVGLILVAARDLGLEIPDMPGYRRTPDPQKFIGHIFANSNPETETVPGHFGVFRDGTQPCHAGIFAEKNGVTTLIHAYAGTGIVMEEPFIHDWPRRLFAIRSIKDLV